jgi:hypothetical protein
MMRAFSMTKASLMTKVSLWMCLLVSVGSRVLPAQDARPNLSGRWVMNAARSTLPLFRNQAGSEGGGVHIDTCCVPKSIVEVIDHHEPGLTVSLNEIDVDNQGGEHPLNVVSRLTTDNRADANGKRSRWEFDQLVTVSGSDGSQAIKIRTLSADGLTLTEDVYLGARQGRPVMTLVLERSTPKP